MDEVETPALRMLICLDLLRPVATITDPYAFERASGAARRLLAHARHQRWEVVHCHGADLPPRAIGGLEPLPSEPVYLREGASAFSSRAFRRRIKLWPRPELVIIGGSAIACMATALAAFDRRLPAILAVDAVSVGHDNGLDVDALARVINRMIAPFIQLSHTADLMDRRRVLHLVAAS